MNDSETQILRYLRESSWDTLPGRQRRTVCSIASYTGLAESTIRRNCENLLATGKVSYDWAGPYGAKRWFITVDASEYCPRESDRCGSMSPGRRRCTARKDHLKLHTNHHHLFGRVIETWAEATPACAAPGGGSNDGTTPSPHAEGRECLQRSMANWVCNAPHEHSGNHTAYIGPSRVLEVWARGTTGGPGLQPGCSTLVTSCLEPSPDGMYECSAVNGHPGRHTARLGHSPEGDVRTSWEGSGGGTEGAQPRGKPIYQCYEKDPATGYRCNAVGKHPGLHTAYSGDRVLTTWSDGAQPRARGGTTYRPFHPRLCPARLGDISGCTCDDESPWFDGTLPPLLEDGDSGEDMPAEMIRRDYTRKVVGS
jgi:hypothetical protein